MNNDIIENLRLVDVPLVASLHSRCFFDAWDSKTIGQILEMAGTFGLVSRGANARSIVGFAIARVAADECELLTLGVAPECRSIGFGAQLLQATMTRAVFEKAKGVFLEVSEDNLAALQLYRSNGFVKVGNRPQYYENADGTRSNAYTMRVALPRSTVFNISENTGNV